MNKFLIVAAALAVTLPTAAFAQAGPADPYGDATVAKADAAIVDAARFDQLDTNHDGNIAGDEVAAAGRGVGRADTNGDGSISKAEFLAAQAGRFDMMDGSHDGQLTKAERDAFRAEMMERMRSNGQ